VLFLLGLADSIVAAVLTFWVLRSFGDAEGFTSPAQQSERRKDLPRRRIKRTPPASKIDILAVDPIVSILDRFNRLLVGGNRLQLSEGYDQTLFFPANQDKHRLLTRLFQSAADCFFFSKAVPHSSRHFLITIPPPRFGSPGNFPRVTYLPRKGLNISQI
jgi:hypothetical protein